METEEYNHWARECCGKFMEAAIEQLGDKEASASEMAAPGLAYAAHMMMQPIHEYEAGTPEEKIKMFSFIEQHLISSIEDLMNSHLDNYQRVRGEKNG